jgi:16S rRNA (adenine1518-N6/adenine1519-N6)-dimethyltransferase
VSHPHQQLGDLGARALKSLSQNFLTSPHWADKLSDAATSIDADELWEIGPGLGALTQKLVANSKIPLRLFEFDKKLAARLEANHPNVPIVHGDVLKADFETTAAGRRIAVLSNLPYHLSSPILFKFLESPVDWQGFVLTFQKEYAERLLATAGDSDYGSLSVVFQWHFESEKLGVIPPGAFYPPPKVDSIGLKLKLKGAKPPPEWSTLVRTAFQFRRKTLSNCLKGKVPKDQLATALEKIGFSLQSRPEDISPQQYFTLASELGHWFSQRFPNDASNGKQGSSTKS